MQKPKVVIFDIGNVLLHWDPDQLYQKLIPDAEARNAFYTEVDTHNMNLAVDRGAPFKETIYATAENHPRYRDLIRAWHDRWIEMAAPLIEESCDILRGLRRDGVTVFALSNFGVDSFAYAETVYPVLTEFDRRYISGHLKLIKPDPAIYAAVEADCGLSGNDLFFIDDSPANIAAADARGWQTEHFTSADNLRTALNARGFSV